MADIRESLESILDDLNRSLNQSGDMSRAYTATARNNLERVIEQLKNVERRELAEFKAAAKRFNDRLREENERYQRHCESHQ